MATSTFGWALAFANDPAIHVHPVALDRGQGDDGGDRQVRQGKPSSGMSKYLGFLGCEYNSVVETVTDEEDGQGWTAFGFINAGAVLSVRIAVATDVVTPIQLVFVGTAAAMDFGAMAKANKECTEQIYH